MKLKDLKPLHFILLGAFVTIAGSLLPVYKFFLGDTPVIVNYLTITGGIITAVATLCHNIASSAKSTAILLNTAAHLKQIDELQVKNAALSVKLEQMNEEIKGNITGGDSFARVDFTNNDDKKVLLIAVNNGRYPLTDYNFQVLDHLGWKKYYKEQTEFSCNVRTFDPSERAPFLTLFTAQLIAPGTFVGLGELFFRDESPDKAFMIFSSGKNGLFSQLVKLHKLESGEWVTATKVIQESDRSVLFEEIHPLFPKEQLPLKLHD